LLLRQSRIDAAHFLCQLRNKIRRRIRRFAERFRCALQAIADLGLLITLSFFDSRLKKAF
jgi:hypothetical protein